MKRYMLILLLMPLLFIEAFTQQNIQSPKNIIIFIADGWGENQMLAAQFYHGEKQVYQNFPVRYYMSTYPAKTAINNSEPEYWSTGYDSYKAWFDFDYLKENYTGSAASATALATGTKTANKLVGLDVNLRQLENISERSARIGKASGVVTTVPISHATPAGFTVHNENRDNYAQIARDIFIDTKLNVIMGCGHPYYNNNNIELDPNDTSKIDFNYIGGPNAWKNLKAGSAEFEIGSLCGEKKTRDIDGDNRPDPWFLIDSKKDFDNLVSNPNPPLRVAGIAQSRKTLQQARLKTVSTYTGKNGLEPAYTIPFNTSVPDLKTMTLGALNVLSHHDNNKGFFLMVEGGAIDWAGHYRQPGRNIEEMHDFDLAVKAVVKWVEENSSWNETLIIVTGDHECGYLTGSDDDDDFENSLADYHVKDRGKGNMPEMYFHSGSHTNQLIPFFAKGAGANIFNSFADETDMHRGKYITNSEVGKAMMLLWNVN